MNARQSCIRSVCKIPNMSYADILLTRISKGYLIHYMTLPAVSYYQSTASCRKVVQLALDKDDLRNETCSKYF